MKVIVNNTIKAEVGDIIEFNHKGSHGEGSHYLICYTDREGYFIINLSGKKNGMIKFYQNLSTLLKIHEDSIIKIYSQNEWNLEMRY